MTAFESVHADTLKLLGPAYPATPCAKCTAPTTKGGLGLKSCVHNVKVFEIDAAKVEARVVADIQASIRGSKI
jgi:hypothetical protein